MFQRLAEFKLQKESWVELYPSIIPLWDLLFCIRRGFLGNVFLGLRTTYYSSNESAFKLQVGNVQWGNWTLVLCMVSICRSFLIARELFTF